MIKNYKLKIKNSLFIFSFFSCIMDIMRGKKIVNVPIREEVIIKKVASKSVIFATACVCLILGIGLTAGYFIVKDIANQSKSAAERDVQITLDKVGRLVILPSDTPTVATVTDKTKLLDKPFFRNAENGDKVLIFTVSKRAILYRPSVGKIVEMGPVVPQESSKVIDVTVAPLAPTVVPKSKK